MKLKLPPLPYAYDALEPHLSVDTVKTHYLKHHQKYIDTLNKLISGTQFEGMAIEEIILETKLSKEHEKIFNNAAQAWNHTFYWSSMTPKKNKKPSSHLARLIDANFGSFKGLTDEFRSQALNLFGSGWVWLIKDENGSLDIVSTKDADTPIAHGQIPILGLDVWEHAYYLDYKSERAVYFDHFWKITDWEFAESRFNEETFRPSGLTVMTDDFMKGMNSILPGFDQAN